jgi:hypothetical protein
MAVNYNCGSIVTNGLVLALDAANPKSYPGSGTTWTDLSGNGNNGTLVNSPTYSNLNGGNFNFDEIDDYVNCGQILNNSAYTKIAWFRPESSTQNIVSGSQGNTAFWMNNTSTTLFSGHNGAWTTISYSPGDMLNEWWCGAVTFNTSTGWVMYLNGGQVNTNTSTTAPTGNGTIRIGAHAAGSNLFDGDIPYVQLYNRALTAQEIQQNFNATRSRFSI